jgi:hypothetical protein
LPDAIQCRQNIQPTLPANASRENSIVLARMATSASYLDPELRTCEQYPAAHGFSLINKRPPMVAGAFIAMNGCNASNQRGRWFMKKQGNGLPVSSSNSCWQKDLDGISEWK